MAEQAIDVQKHKAVSPAERRETVHWLQSEFDSASAEYVVWWASVEVRCGTNPRKQGLREGVRSLEIERLELDI